jgi:hypothetical protein
MVAPRSDTPPATGLEGPGGRSERARRVIRPVSDGDLTVLLFEERGVALSGISGPRPAPQRGTKVVRSPSADSVLRPGGRFEPGSPGLCLTRPRDTLSRRVHAMSRPG